MLHTEQGTTKNCYNDKILLVNISIIFLNLELGTQQNFRWFEKGCLMSINSNSRQEKFTYYKMSTQGQEGRKAGLGYIGWKHKLQKLWQEIINNMLHLIMPSVCPSN